MKPFYRWRWPSGRYGNVAWRFRTRKECEKHYRGFDGEAALMEEREVKKNVKTCWIARGLNGVYSAHQFKRDDFGPGSYRTGSGGSCVRASDITFETVFGVQLEAGHPPVEFRLERVVRKRGKFAKRKPRVPAPKNWTGKDVRKMRKARKA